MKDGFWRWWVVVMHAMGKDKGESERGGFGLGGGEWEPGFVGIDILVPM